MYLVMQIIKVTNEEFLANIMTCKCTRRRPRKKKKDDWKTIHNWPRCKSQEERKDDRQHPNHITSSRRITLRSLRLAKKVKILAYRWRCSEVFSQKSAVNELQCNDRLLPHSASTKKPRMLDGQKGSPLTTCQFFSAQCFDLSLLKADFPP